MFTMNPVHTDRLRATTLTTAAERHRCSPSSLQR
jgi:hypothetical protein